MTGIKKLTTSRKVNMTVNLGEDYYNFLKKLSFELSLKENKKVGLSEVVRRALVLKYPITSKKIVK